MRKRLAHSMRFKIIVSICTMILVLMLFSILFFRFAFNDYLMGHAYDNLSALITQTGDSLKTSFGMVENSIEYFSMDQTIQKWIKEDSGKNLTAAGRLTAQLGLDAALKHSIIIGNEEQNELMDTAVFYVNDKSYSLYARGKTNLVTLTNQGNEIFREMNRNPADETTMYPKYSEESKKHSLYFGKSFYDKEISKSILNLIIGVDEETLFSKYENAIQYPGTLAYVVDGDGKIYSSADKSILGTALPNDLQKIMRQESLKELETGDGVYYAMSRGISKTGLRFVIGIPKESFAASVNAISSKYVVVMLMVFFVFLLLSIFIAYISTRFLKDMAKSLTDIKHGNFRARMPAYKTTELREVSDTFNEMADRIDYLINQIYEKQLAVKKADIKFLQSQINPHFLFNTFAAIGTKAKLAKEETIYRMINSVSMLLQAGFNADDSLITVAEELEYIKCYLYIQKERFGERLHYEINISDDRVLDAPIPRLCVEPIVENSVIHGLEVKKNRGSVILNVILEDDTILFEVIDDGVGFSPGRTQIEAKPGEDTGKSIGLKNTHKRLRLIYGNNYGVFIDAEREAGARVVVKIPFETTGGPQHV